MGFLMNKLALFLALFYLTSPTFANSKKKEINIKSSQIKLDDNTKLDSILHKLIYQQTSKDSELNDNLDLDRGHDQNNIIRLNNIQNSLLLSGGHESGGGTGILKGSSDGTIYLLDLINFDSNFTDTIQIKSELKLKRGKSATLGFEILDIESLLIYKFLENHLSRWQRTSPHFIKWILSQVKKTEFIPIDTYLTQDLSQSLGIDVRKMLSVFPVATIHRAVTYTFRDGAFLSLPVWNQMGDMSKAGLLIHEALRRVQIVGKNQLSTDEIVNLTAMLMLGNPDDYNSISEIENYPKALNELVSSNVDLISFFNGVLDIYNRIETDNKEVIATVDQVRDYYKRNIPFQNGNLEQRVEIKILQDLDYFLNDLKLLAHIFDLEIDSDAVNNLNEKLDRVIGNSLNESMANQTINLNSWTRGGNPFLNTFFHVDDSGERLMDKVVKKLKVNGSSFVNGVSLREYVRYGE